MLEISILHEVLSIAIAGRDWFMRCEQTQFEKKKKKPLSSFSMHSTGRRGALKKKKGDVTMRHTISICRTFQSRKERDTNVAPL